MSVDTYLKPIPTNPTKLILQPKSQGNYFAALGVEFDDDDDVTVVTSNKNRDHAQDAVTQIATCIEDDDRTDEIDENGPTHAMFQMGAGPPMATRITAWRQIVQAKNLQQLPLASTIFNPQKITRAVKHAISDSGATGHFLVEGAPVVNKQIAKRPIAITLPNGKIIQSTHTCNLDIPWLPSEITEAHIVPGLAHASLISTRKFCDAGCKVVFDLQECRVYYKNRLVLVGGRDEATQLWKLPINPTKNPNDASTTIANLDLHVMPKQKISHTANALYTLPYKQNQLKYMHQAFFNPPVQTLIKAALNGQLEGIPFMKADLIRKYLPPSPATPKGRMKRPRAGIRSTRKKERNGGTNEAMLEDDNSAMSHHTPSNTTANIIQSDETHEANNIFCYAALADKQTGTLYTDATGSLPVMSLDGYQYFFVAYDYDTNYIFANPIKDVKDATIVQAFDDIFTELTEKGHKPTFNVTDNQATTPIKNYLKKANCRWQFVEPSNHRVNAAERAIQTFKNHFISGLCSTDKEWPLQLWDQLAVQAVVTLNLLRTSHIDPSKSAYHQLNGHKYDWNSYIMAPPGTRAVIYEDPDSRTAWGARGTDAWYCGPSFDHYRNCIFYVPETRSFRTSGSFDLFPQHCLLPEFTPEQHAAEVQDELHESIQRLSRPAKAKLLKQVAQSLRILATEAAEKPLQRVASTPTSEGGTAIQRVAAAPPITTTTNPTAPRTIQGKPRTHQRTTRNNTPGAVPPIKSKVTAPRRSARLSQIEIIEPCIINKTPNSFRIPLANPNIISQDAVNLLTDNVFKDNDEKWRPDAFITANPTGRNQNVYDADIEHFCAPVVHPTTGETITQYRKLANDPATRDVWSTAFGKEFGRMSQGDNKTGQKGKQCIFVMSHSEIAKIPTDRVVTYARVVVDYRAQKKDPNRVRITAGGNLITCPGDLTCRTADLTTSKILWNSVLSTEGAKFMGLDVGNFYLETPMERYEYMKMPLALFPAHTIEQYKLHDRAKNGFVYLEIRRAIYGLPQAGSLANKQLRKYLAPAGYYECAHTPGLWRHVTRPIHFSLVVDDFGVKYVGKEHADHLIQTLRKHYEAVTEDWEGKLYCGITLEWNYTERWLDISMPGYVEKLRKRYHHEVPSKPQHSPYRAPPKIFGAAAQDTIPADTTERIDEKRIKVVQQVVGGLLYYARAVDLTILPALSAIASEQTKATEATEARVDQLLDYVATKPNAKVRYHASDMILNIHSDASYLSETQARSRVAGQFFLGSTPVKGQSIVLNGAIFILCGILKFVVASAAEAELGALFLNCKEGKIIRLILEEMGHIQPPTPVHCDNVTAAGIANDTVKKQRSRSMEMRFFWITDQVKLRAFDVQWHPGQENLADYFTKHFDGKHHREVRPWYLHEANSPRVLPRASAPSALRGCVGNLPNGYIRNVPLPLVPLRPLVPVQVGAYSRVPLRPLVPVQVGAKVRVPVGHLGKLPRGYRAHTAYSQQRLRPRVSV